MGRAIRSDSLSGTGVGPGVSRRIFFTMLPPRVAPVGLRAVSAACQDACDRHTRRRAGDLASSGEHAAHHGDEQIDVAFIEVVPAARLDEGAIDGIGGRSLLVLREQFCQADVEGVGDRGQRLQMGSTLAALDHGKEGDADPGALAQFLLRHPRARRPQLPDPASDFPDDGSLYGPLPGSPPSAYVPASAGASKMLRGKVHHLNSKAPPKEIVTKPPSAAATRTPPRIRAISSRSTGRIAGPPAPAGHGSAR